MKVILTQNVPELGEAGEVTDVAAGYARNYLIPKGLAVFATPGAIKQRSVYKKAQKEREARMAEQAAELVAQLAGVTLTFEAKAGPTGRLYGSITTSDIAQALNRELEVDVDRRKIVSDPLRDVGEHVVTVRVSSDAVGEVRVVIQPEGGALVPHEGEEPVPQEPVEAEADE